MDNLTTITSHSTNQYFNLLSYVGYLKQTEVDKLLVISFIEELLNSDLAFSITEQEYKLMMQVVFCLIGDSCLFTDYPFLGYEATIRDNRDMFIPRITEDRQLRKTQQSEFRVQI